MCPEGSSRNLDLLTCPRFFWDIRAVPWTDGKRDQHEYVKAVCRRSAFHENLPDGNSNKITDKNRGTVLLSNLYGSAKELCDKIEDVVLNPDAAKSTELIISTMYKRDPLSVVTVVYEELQKLLLLAEEVTNPTRILSHVLLYISQNLML